MNKIPQELIEAFQVPNVNIENFFAYAPGAEVDRMWVRVDRWIARAYTPTLSYENPTKFTRTVLYQEARG